VQFPEATGFLWERKEFVMIHSIDALISRNGNVVRSGIARPATVARYLAQAHPLADYEVMYWLHRRPHCVTGEGFLALYEAGRIPNPKPLKESNP
jgi:hypothetical protein